MKFDKNYLLNLVFRIESLAKRFRFIIMFVIFSLMYGYILIQINLVNSRQPSQSQIESNLMEPSKSKINPEYVDKITSLEEESVDIKAIFNEARKNPFAE